MAKLNKSALLKVSLASDVQHSGGKLAITGLETVRTSRILDIKQIKYKTEVVQVVKIGYSLYTPVADTTYEFTVESLTQKREGFVDVKRIYSYHTPVTITTLGATAALQREAIHVALLAKVAADTANGRVDVIGATLGTGTGITLTDRAGYYAVNGTRKGASTIRLVTNPDGSGWVDTTAENIVTTAAVYSFGEGQKLLDAQPIQDSSLGGLISGNFEAPKTIGIAGTYATAGQHYDAFTISSLKVCPAHAVTDQFAYQDQEQIIFVDNGTGTATTNLTGFIAFERAMLKEIFALYSNDPQSVIEWFDRDFVIQGPLGAVPVTTTATNNSLAVYNKFLTAYGELDHRNIGTQTIVSPTQGAVGLLIDQDVATGDGAHYSPSLTTLNDQQFIVGKTECSVIAKYSTHLVAGANFQVGFHEKNVFFLDWNDYVNLASAGTDNTAGAIVTRGILANAATVSTVSATVTVADIVSEFIVKVDINGVVTCMVNDITYPVYSVGTTPLVFAAGTVLVPFYQQTNITGTIAVGTISAFAAVPTINWRIG